MKPRQSNFEMLRITSMLLIIAFHYIYKSGFDLSNWYGWVGVANKIIVDICYHFGELGVNCFMLISGFFFDKTTFKWKKLILLILEIEFYIILSRGILVFLGISTWNTWKMSSYLFPVLKNNYWFVTVWVLIYLLSPYLKKLIEILSQKELEKLILSQLLLTA